MIVANIIRQVKVKRYYDLEIDLNINHKDYTCDDGLLAEEHVDLSIAATL